MHFITDIVPNNLSQNVYQRTYPSLDGSTERFRHVFKPCKSKDRSEKMGEINGHSRLFTHRVWKRPLLSGMGVKQEGSRFSGEESLS